MLLLIDNYDSFTYNLYQYLAELGEEMLVVRNDMITLDEVEALAPERIVISPGPCTPAEAGISTETIRRFAGRVPILGVCLGHQCIAEAFGGRVGAAGEIMHGKMSLIEHDGEGVFRGLPNPFRAVRYHSLAADPISLPDELVVTARSESGVIMGVRHRRFAVEGVQFHPESIMTEVGKDLLRNFLAIEEKAAVRP
ncbi:MAG TPA: aminodeoxychorismate/anthranilate synthase component II [Dehalococcoidia bacterium]|nr:aminodeoxychorismate/anthranilate synthase component II [Dehalococcoidia bacterium]